MELYLDSADINEIKEVFKLGFLDGLTTTPTFMHRHGITDIDAMILELAALVPVLQIEALGNNADEIEKEALRLLDLGLDINKTVFKIPVSLEGTAACQRLVKRGMMVNVHLVYTIQQAYMAMSAGATYVCPLVGRAQDQGLDALSLVAQCVDTVNYYGYDTRIMFSSVRNAEHVRNALNAGAHTITVPWKVLKNLTENHFTTIGTQQFVEHTRLMTMRVKDAMTHANPIARPDMLISECLVAMTAGGFGAVTIVDDNDRPIGIFTDGDLRRLLSKHQNSVHSMPVKEKGLKPPISIESNEILNVASDLFKEKHVDVLVVTENGKAIGMLDIQDLVSDTL
jgi:TalC/MipB family fructose-6-phosphate aldolase